LTLCRPCWNALALGQRREPTSVIVTPIRRGVGVQMRLDDLMPDVERAA
jgi:hypothetical protein